MNKISGQPLSLSLIVLLLWGLAFTHPAQAQGPVTPVTDIIELEKKDTPQVQLSKPVESIDTSSLQGHIATQRDLSPEDTQNLTLLWKAVIDRNPIIQFSLKSLATPPELRYAQSSIMSRTVAGLLSGAALLPYAMGADQLTAGATNVSANLAYRALQQSKKVDPALLPSDTELVELSGLVQSLQQTLVEHYFQYKQGLTATLKYSNAMGKLQTQYQQALASKTPEEALWLRQLYHQAATQKLLSWQASKRHYLILERLVGHQTMQAIRFGDGTVPAVKTPSQTPMVSSKTEEQPSVK